MENNVFIKMSKTKFNPDIDKKIKVEEFERNNTKYNMTNVIYNPITGVVPSNINSANDLMLNKDKSINSREFNELLKAKEIERQNINDINPVKTKVISESHSDRTNYIETFEELRKPKNQQKSINNNNNGYNNIMDQLKSLGILN